MDSQKVPAHVHVILWVVVLSLILFHACSDHGHKNEANAQTIERPCEYVHSPWIDPERRLQMTLCGCEGRAVTIADITKLRRALAGREVH